MRKKFLLLPVAAMLALTSCSSDEPGINGGENPAGESRYLAVSIVTTGNGNTRATGDPSVGTQYEDGDLTYEDGLEKENEVKSLRIYFFGPKGQPINVKGRSDGGNCYDVPTKEIVTTPGEQGETVEKKINAVLLVNAGEGMPSQLVAVLNPRVDLGTKYDLAGLRRVIADYATLANENGKFVMTNSTYVDGGRMVEAATILPENYGKTADEAKNNPVTIYVERNVAKVRVNASVTDKNPLEGGGIMFPVYDKETKEQITITRTKEDGTSEDVNVYVKFLAWDITADLKYAYLCKNVRVGWRQNILGSGNWNDATNHRSYWADVCDGGTDVTNNSNQYFAYEGKTGEEFNHFNLKKFDGTEWKYCNENGEKNGSNIIYKPTDVIIKGELCDQNGNPLTITEIAGTRVIDGTDFSALKDVYLQMLKSGKAHSHYKVTKDDSGNTHIAEISASDITFMTATDAANKYPEAKASQDKTGTYYVYACLTEEAAKADWYTSVTIEGNGDDLEYKIDEKSVKTTVTAVNQHLYEMGHAKIWNSGMTYYYTEIMQSATTAGVVRNHIYDVNLKNVYGIGTPVYNPIETIIPEKPNPDDTFIAAEIKILSWRLITNDVDLEWD